MADKSKRRKTSGVICLLAGIAGAIELVFFTQGIQIFGTTAAGMLVAVGVNELKST